MTPEAMIRQYNRAHRTLANGDKVMAVQGGVYDLFSGSGWLEHIRFRVLRFRDKTKPAQLIQISSGLSLSSEYREKLLKELS